MPGCSIFTYNDKIAEPQRRMVLADFPDSTGKSIIIVGRRAGGEGLNLQTANCLILRSVLWSPCWKEQGHCSSPSHWTAGHHIRPYHPRKQLRYGGAQLSFHI